MMAPRRISGEGTAGSAIQVDQRSTCSAIVRASSTSDPGHGRCFSICDGPTLTVVRATSGFDPVPDRQPSQKVDSEKNKQIWIIENLAWGQHSSECGRLVAAPSARWVSIISPLWPEALSEQRGPGAKDQSPSGPSVQLFGIADALREAKRRKRAKCSPRPADGFPTYAALTTPRPPRAPC